jgi:hypothetical protein
MTTIKLMSGLLGTAATLGVSGQALAEPCNTAAPPAVVYHDAGYYNNGYGYGNGYGYRPRFEARRDFRRERFEREHAGRRYEWERARSPWHRGW